MIRVFSYAGSSGGFEVVLHFDMDAFYVSVKVREDPGLRGLAVGVGRTDSGFSRGVVLSASYRARSCGVRGGMLVVVAKRLCPELVMVRPRFGLYARVSREVFGVVRGFGFPVRRASIDEGFVLLSGGFSWGDVAGLREFLVGFKRVVRDCCGLPLSVGVGPSCVLAKVVTGLSKPDGLGVLEPWLVVERLRDLPVSVIPGVGRRSSELLGARGVVRVGDVLGSGVVSGRLVDFIRGVVLLRGGGWCGSGVGRRRSFGKDRTLRAGVGEFGRVRVVLHELVVGLCAGLRERKWLARTVTVRVKPRHGVVLSKSFSFLKAHDDALRFLEVVDDLFHALVPAPAPVRLVGVRFTNIEVIPKDQLTLDDFMRKQGDDSSNVR